MQTNLLQPAASAEANDSRTASDKAVGCKELLACPFCGAPAGEVIHHFQPQLRVDGTTYEARSVQCSQIFKGCMGAGPIKDSEPEARAAWNTRWQANAKLTDGAGTNV